MNPELQTLVDRVELLERQSGNLRAIAILSMLVAIAAIVVPPLLPRAASLIPSKTARFTAIEANRIVLRDPDSRPVGGLEVDRNGTIRLVLGRAGATGAVLIEAQQNGVAHLTLKGPDGTALASLVGSRRPELSIGVRNGGPSVSMGARDDGAGSFTAWDGQGRVKFRAP